MDCAETTLPVLESKEMAAFHVDSASVVVCHLTTHLTGASSFRVAVEPTAANGLRARSEVMVERVAGVARVRLREVWDSLTAPR